MVSVLNVSTYDGQLAARTCGDFSGDYTASPNQIEASGESAEEDEHELLYSPPPLPHVSTAGRSRRSRHTRQS